MPAHHKTPYPACPRNPRRRVGCAQKIVAEIRDEQRYASIERGGQRGLPAVSVHEPVSASSCEGPAEQASGRKWIRERRTVAADEEHVAAQPKRDERLHLPLDEDAIGVVVLVRPTVRYDEHIGAMIPTFPGQERPFLHAAAFAGRRFVSSHCASA